MKARIGKALVNQSTRRKWWADLVIVLLLTGLALAPRLYRLSEIPPGLYGDEAANGADIVNLVHNGQFPIFFERNTGREPLFIYLQAMVLALLGATPLALRLTAALIGTATVPAVYWMVRAAFRNSRHVGRWPALWTAMFLAFSYWHVNFSRLGLRVIMLPLVAALAFAWFWRAWPDVLVDRDVRVRKDDPGTELSLADATRWPWVDLLLCGVCVGVSLYTYLAARMLPLLLLLVIAAGVLEPGSSWARARRAAGGLGIIAGTAMLVFLPLGMYFLSHPGSFMGHAASVSFLASPAQPANGKLLALAGNLLRTVSMFGLSSDPLWLENPAQRPAFDLIISAWLVAGVVLALAYRRSLPYLFALLWLIVFSLPAVLSGSLPSYLRSLGMLPAACLLPVLAMLAAGHWLASRAPVRARWPAALANWLPLPFVIFSGYTGLQAYFGAFNHTATDPNALAAFDMRIMQIAPFIKQNDGPDQAWILPLLPISGLPDRWEYADNFNFLTRTTPRLRAVVTAEDLTNLAQGRHYGNLIIWHYTALEANNSYAYVDSKRRMAFLLNKYGRLVDTRADPYATYETYELPKVPAYQVAEQIAPQELAFGDKLTLTGVAYGHTANSSDEQAASLEEKQTPSGHEAWVILRWKAQEALPNTWKASLYLTDKAGHVAGQVDDVILSNDYLWGVGWQPGETGLTYHILSTLPAVAPGHYNLQLAVYDSATGQRLPVIQADGTQTSTAARLGPLEITPPISPPQVAPSTRLPQPVALAPGLVLLGHDALPTVSGPGTTLPLTIYWQAIDRPVADYAVRLMLRDDQGKLVMQQTNLPAGSFSTLQWLPGEIVRSWQDLTIPVATPQGDYRLEVTLEGPEAPASPQVLGTLRVAGRPHLFNPPTATYPQDLRVGEEILFLGHDLAGTQLQAGSPLSLTLHWQDRAPANRSYTVFVHLVGSDGHLWAQQDHVPGDGTLATTTWLPGEYLADSYCLDLRPETPPGNYRLEIGMYDAATGQRLQVTDGAGAPKGDHILLEPAIELRTRN